MPMVKLFVGGRRRALRYLAVRGLAPPEVPWDRISAIKAPDEGGAGRRVATAMKPTGRLRNRAVTISGRAPRTKEATC